MVVSKVRSGAFDTAMIDTFLKLFQLLTRKQRRELYILQILVIIASMSELVSTVSIMPFIALAANPGIVDTNEYLSRLHDYVGSPNHDVFLLYVGVCFIALVVLSNGLLLADQFFMSRYSFRLGGEISSRLYGYYLAKDIVFHSVTNSATLIQRVMRDSEVLSTSLLAPALKLNARLVSVILLGGLILYADPVVAIATLLLLGAVYWFIFYVIRGTVYSNGKIISGYDQKRNRLLNESFGGIKDMKLYSFEDAYLKNYSAATKLSTRAAADNMILGESPYYLVESVVFAGMVALTLYLFSSTGGMADALPILTLYGMAGMKIVPKLQQAYMAVTRIRGAQAAFSSIYPDLKAASGGVRIGEKLVEPLRPVSTIELRDITFGYQTGLKPVFNAYSAQFKVGEMTAVVGPSGMGKSTLLDILMGLVEPEHGGIFVDGEAVTTASLASWRSAIGYVPQDVYLTDTNPAANIAFGVEEEEIDMERVIAAARMAEIHDFIETLPGKYGATIGERGAQFSGGQRQRIGLARAFYRDVSVLILDEATSALDNATQSEILNNLRSMDANLTIIMVTHRSAGITAADRVVDLAHP